MSEEENIPEKSPKDGKSESPEENPGKTILPAGQAGSPPETIEQTETQIEKSDISKSAIENMEVHHHPHVEKKSFKEYLLEGLMIFLAVTMGFFAENIREVYKEHETANTYAGEMVQDLTADTAQLHNYRRYTSGAAATIDTFLQLLSSAEPKDIPSGKLYWYGLLGAASRTFRPNDAAFQQMKSSGSLRFLDRSIAQKITEYEQLCRTIEATEETDHGIYIEVRKLRGQIFEFGYNITANEIFQANFTTSSYNKQRVDSFVNSNPPLLTTDKVIFNEYAELIRSRFMGRKAVAADTLLSHATILLTEIKNNTI